LSPQHDQVSPTPQHDPVSMMEMEGHIVPRKAGTHIASPCPYRTLPQPSPQHESVSVMEMEGHTFPRKAGTHISSPCPTHYSEKGRDTHICTVTHYSEKGRDTHICTVSVPYSPRAVSATRPSPSPQHDQVSPSPQHDQVSVMEIGHTIPRKAGTHTSAPCRDTHICTVSVPYSPRAVSATRPTVSATRPSVGDGNRTHYSEKGRDTHTSAPCPYRTLPEPSPQHDQPSPQHDQVSVMEIGHTIPRKAGTHTSAPCPYRTLPEPSPQHGQVSVMEMEGHTVPRKAGTHISAPCPYRTLPEPSPQHGQLSVMEMEGHTVSEKGRDTHIRIASVLHSPRAVSATRQSVGDGNGRPRYLTTFHRTAQRSSSSCKNLEIFRNIIHQQRLRK
ncbi:hypothetical protein L9F63_015625, partial [Diploptera punctata]